MTHAQEQAQGDLARVFSTFEEFVKCFHFVTDVEGTVLALQQDSSIGTDRERKFLSELKVLLSEEEWSELPTAVATALANKSFTNAAWKQLRERYSAEIEGEKRQRAESERVLREAQIRAEHIRARARELLETNFIDAEECLVTEFGELPEELVLDSARTRYFIEWCAANWKWRPDLEQARAASHVKGHVRLTARAGSGKTSVLVHRAAFLMQHCNVSGDEILMLAFNNKAAAEMRERVTALIPASLTPPIVLTFHALAYAIAKPMQTLLTDDPNDEEPQLTKFVAEAIRDVSDDHQIAQLARSVMTLFFKSDLNLEEAQLLGMSAAERLDYLKNVRQQSLNGEPVKSFGEKKIANFLFERGIPYKYEKAYEWDMRPHRPDFTVNPWWNGSSFADDQRGLKPAAIIEYFGLAGTSPEYDKQIQDKRNHWRDKGVELVEVLPQHLSLPDFDEKFTAYLERVTGKSLPPIQNDEQIWKRVKKRAITNLSKAVKGSIIRARQLDLEPEDVRNLTAQLNDLPTLLNLYIELVSIVYKKYLESEETEDFTGLLIEARKRLRDGQNEAHRKDRLVDLTKLRFVMLDEYQDFNHQFQSLVDGIRSHSPSAQIFAVGDDWQSINRFAGADLKYFHQFENYFSEPTELNLVNNYRSIPAVVQLGNAVMAGHGIPGRSAQGDAHPAFWLDVRTISVTDAESKRIQRRWQHMAALERVVNKAITQADRIHLLSRKQPDFEALDHLKRLFPEAEDRITASTVHKFKGNEADCIILTDATDRQFPLIHPYWIFDSIFGNSIERILEDERRLLYVALTRAKTHLYVLTDSKNMSRYLSVLPEGPLWRHLDWQYLPPVVPSLPEANE